MKTQFILMSTVAVLGASLVTTSYAAPPSEYLHFTRHRDSNGNLLMGPTQHQAEPSVVQKMVMPSQPKTFERRSTDWGMSVQEVQENEPIQSIWELQPPVLGDFEQRVAYHTQIEGVEAALTYTFYHNHLGQAKYVFEPQHEDAVEYVQDFQTIKGWISQSYGAPASAQEIWLDTLYQYDKSLWGQALKRGHLVMVAEWKNPGTDIVLVLDGGDDTVGLVADFASTTFVVPVSLDTESAAQQVQEVIEDTTIQEALPNEPLSDPVVEEAAVQDSSPVMGGSGEFHSETEVASQTSEHDIQDLQEIEQMLNEEFPIQETGEPVTEGGPVDSSMVEPVSEIAPMEDQAAQALGNPESVIEETLVEADATVHASVGAEEGEQAVTEEEMVEQMMEADTELAPQHL
ncbi:MAG: hypothetical protein OEZ57_09545 [Nitrospirota bacterium]|nr:hypothetical protein [Nitrospirota bacterium]MDH5585376.1 hypothetical protein [Nitrospirota bacterium]MDH5775141.1 hypothetical protein [Nitrospirota bacterium]